MIPQLRIALIALALLPITASAQLQYGYSTFVHGLNDNSARFTTPNTAGLLGPMVDLKNSQFPSLNGSLSIDSQANNLFNYIAPDQGGQHVLVGLSMGGLTSRYTYFSHPALISGIIAVATPHQGAPIADNASLAAGYFADQVTGFFDTVIDIVLRPSAGGLLSAVVVAMLRVFGLEYLNGRIVAFLNAEFGVKGAGLHDIKTSSPTIATLGSQLEAIPFANVLGTVGRRNAAFRVGFSALYDDAGFEPAMGRKNMVKSAVKMCRQIGYNIIVRTSVGRMCNQIDNSIGSIDDRWAFFTMGASDKRNPDATFDGLVPTSRSRYPGTTLSDPTVNFRAPTVNHMNIQYNPLGINRIAEAMLQIGMGAGPGSPPPPPPPPSPCQPVPPQVSCES